MRHLSCDDAWDKPAGDEPYGMVVQESEGDGESEVLMRMLSPLTEAEKEKGIGILEMKRTAPGL